MRGEASTAPPVEGARSPNCSRMVEEFIRGERYR